VVDIGGGAQTSLIEVLAIIAELAGEEVPLHRLPAMQGDVRDTSADTRRARYLLGFESRTSLRAGLEAQYAWTRGSLKEPAPHRSAISRRW
jgi:nucleoside-diphosphate-sugar epimerase